MLEDTNILRGAFGRDHPKRLPADRDRSARRWSIAGIVLGVLWIYGFASLCAVACGLLARTDVQTRSSRLLANAAVLLGFAGLVFTAVLIVV